MQELMPERAEQQFFNNRNSRFDRPSAENKKEAGGTFDLPRMIKTQRLQCSRVRAGISAAVL